MSSQTSGIGNRFGSLAVNISDPSEISKAKPNKIKSEVKSSKRKKASQTITEDSKSSSTNVQKDVKRPAKEHQKSPVSAKEHQNTGSSEKMIDRVNEMEHSNASISQGRSYSKNRGRGTSDARSNLPVRKNKDAPVESGEAHRDSYQNRGRRGSGIASSGFNQNNSGVLIDLDEEVASPVRYDRGRGRYSNRSSSRNVDGEVPNKRGRVYDRHSGTLTGSSAYNKRENRGPDSALLKESNLIPFETSFNNSREKLDNSNIDENYESVSEVPAVVSTFTLDEFRKMKENQQFASVSITEKTDSVIPESNTTNHVPIENTSNRRSRGRGGVGGGFSDRRGRGSGRDQRYPSEGAYRYSRPSSRPYPESSQNQRNVPDEIKIDLEKDFPALNI